MEPVSTLVATISKVLPEIFKAARTASRNRERCRDLACRAEAVASVLETRVVLAAGAGAEEARRRILCRLKDALDDALALVESCRQRQSIVSKLWSSGRRAARFDDVDKRITNCLVDLSAANGASIENKVDGLAARCYRHSARPPPRPLAHAFLPCYPKPPPPPLAHAGVRCCYPSASYGYVVHMEEDRTSSFVLPELSAGPPPPLAYASVPCNCYPCKHGYVSPAAIAEEPTWLQLLQHGVKRALMSSVM